jgi:hypothetical protein
MLSNGAVRLYLQSRWQIDSAKTYIWGAERTNFAFKRSLTPQPSLTAAGIGAAITGAHFDYIWLDDIVTIADRYSAAERRNTIVYFNETENLVDPTGSRMLTSTPWHELDLHSTLPPAIFEGRMVPIGSVEMPVDELSAMWSRKNRMPYAEWSCNYDLKHVEDRDTLGAFLSVPVWDCQYCVGFIDPSFSDKQDSDSTVVAIAGVNRDYIVFTGLKLPRSVADPQTRRDMLDFLAKYTPIETVYESQLSDASVFFLDVFKREEAVYQVKNLWSVKHQSRNKHERIMSIISAHKPEMRILEGTQQDFSIEVSRYYKGVEHDDCPDALAGAVEVLGTSEIVSEYAKAIMLMRR